MYPEGTQICLDEMEGERNMPSGLKGKVCYVDDAGQIHVNWENGSSLAVLPEVDSFHKIGEPHKRNCLLYTSDAADDQLCVDLGGRRIIKKKHCHPAA